MLRCLLHLPRSWVLALLASSALALASPSLAGSIFLTGHDPDFHAAVGSNETGADHFNRIAVDFVTDPLFNPFRADDVTTLLYVESNLNASDLSDPNHTNGGLAAVQAAIAPGLTLEKHDAGTLEGALGRLGNDFAAIVIASDVGGLLSQAELDILNLRSNDILRFLNAGGGLYAMSESNFGAMLTPDGGHFGFLPFVQSVPEDQSAAEFELTTFGDSLGLLLTDIRPDFTHSIFLDDFGLDIVDIDSKQRIVSLAGRGRSGPDGPIPEPGTLLLLSAGALGLFVLRNKS